MSPLTSLLKRALRPAVETLLSHAFRRVESRLVAPLRNEVARQSDRAGRLEADLAAGRAEIDRALGLIATLATEHERLVAQAERLATAGAAASAADRAADREDLLARLARVEAEIADRMLAGRRLIARAGDAERHAPDAPPPDPSRLEPFEATVARLRESAPVAVEIWLGLVASNRAAYEGTPLHSCSVAGHLNAQRFRRFLAPLVTGPLLDLGCGPQDKPLYLADIPDRLIAGLDPLPPFTSHPFAFARGFAESIPWPDASFDLVVSATSLDHVIDPARVLDEVRRVLRPGGRFAVWQSFLPAAPAYDPRAASIQPVDAFHLFQFDQADFVRLLTGLFEIEDFWRSGADESVFFTLAPLKP